MEAKFLFHGKNYVPSLSHKKHTQKRLSRTPILAVLTTQPSNVSGLSERLSPKPADYNLTGLTTKTVYNDSWFDRLAINHLSQSVQAATGFFFWLLILPFVSLLRIKPSNLLVLELTAVSVGYKHTW